MSSSIEKLYPDMSLSEDEEIKVSSNDKLRLISYLSGKKFKNAANTRYLVGGPQNLLDGNTIRIPSVNTGELVHTARSSSACFPVFQCTLSAA